MLKTARIGSCISIQGTFVKTLANGLIQVRVGNQIFTGKPVAAS